jgi:hypothetical protein
MIRPVATLTRDRPWAYVVPRDAESAIELLRRHSGAVERLQEDTEVEVQVYRIEDITYERGVQPCRVDARARGWGRDADRDAPPGELRRQDRADAGAVVSHMLEAETQDGVVYWNHMDAWLPKPELAATRAARARRPSSRSSRS